jgi:hypothetical protein
MARPTLSRRHKHAADVPTDERTGYRTDASDERTDGGSYSATGDRVDDRGTQRGVVATRPYDPDEPRRDPAERHAALRDSYGGMNWGACFFGWLVAVGVVVLLAAIASAIATAVGSNMSWTTSDAKNNASSIGLAAAITLAVVMFIGYYAGGYVAGRMSRFDGTRQGLGVWIIGLVAIVLVAAATAIFGAKYDIADRVNLPNVDLTPDQLGWGGALTAVVLLAVMLVGAILGAGVGRHYHSRIDKAAADY